MAPPRRPKRPAEAAPRYGIARVLSKQGLASRTEAARWVRQGRVRVNGQVVRDPEHPVRMQRDREEVDGEGAEARASLVVMLNKPRGLVTTTQDEQGRDTVYSCFAGADLPWLAPVGRLDKASEGLLLFSNDPVWAARLTDPATGPKKTYHVQINRLPDPALLKALERGVVVEGQALGAASARLLRQGDTNAWLEIVLDEGKNRHIRRLLETFDVEVLRLVRVAIGRLGLGELGKGQWRELTAAELRLLER